MLNYQRVILLLLSTYQLQKHVHFCCRVVGTPCNVFLKGKFFFTHDRLSKSTQVFLDVTLRQVKQKVRKITINQWGKPLENEDVMGINPTVSAWCFGTWMDYDFPFSWECHNHHNPNLRIFFRGLGIPPTSIHFTSLTSHQFPVKKFRNSAGSAWPLFIPCLYILWLFVT